MRLIYSSCHRQPNEVAFALKKRNVSVLDEGAWFFCITFRADELESYCTETYLNVTIPATLLFSSMSV